VFVPRQWENTFFSWMRDIQPWCISRQLWWGHQIPAWYAPDGEVFVERTEAEARAAARAHFGRDVPLMRDEDVLDTWFSSALWPFSTLGWPERTKELARYYPGDVLVTGFDIIFFWVARMMMMGIHFMGAVPFRTVCIHGLIRDEKGQKMSKSKGNVMDPLELIDEYGADALRFTIAALAGPGRDIKLGRKRVEDYRSFGTKLWNAARFCQMNGVRPDPAYDPAKATLPLARWILDASNAALAEANTALEAYRFDEYAGACYRFVWNTFCDWFVEFAKPVLFGPDGAEKEEVRGAAQHVLGVVLRLLHPVMPFITEELWDRLGYGPECSLIRAEWPLATEVEGAEEARVEFNWLVDLIASVRSARSEINVPASANLPLTHILNPIDLFDGVVREDARIERNRSLIERLARISVQPPKGYFTRDKAVDDSIASVQLVLGTNIFMLGVGGAIDLPAERARLAKDLAKVTSEAEKIAAKLGNASFVSRAPEEVVEENRERLAAAQAEMARLDAALARIAG
jgi:valyl-tRNA synthetase